ncbi:MAG: DUF47 family protein [Candidatus Methanomethylophilaceae archaeon]
MSEIKNMLDWFAKRKGDLVQSGNRSHSLVILDVVNEVNNAITAMSAGDKQTVLKSLDRLILSEREADRIEDKLTLSVSDGSLSMQEREDLLHFIKKSDKIADWATEAGTYIQMVIDTETVVPQHIWESSKQMSNELILAMRMLIKAIENLGTNRSETQRCVESIKDQERIIDQMHYTISKKILMSDMDYKGLMLMRGVVQALEESSDACKDCAETIMILISARSL